MRHLVKKRQLAKDASLGQKSLCLHKSVTSPMQHLAKKASLRQKAHLAKKGHLAKRRTCQKIAIWPEKRVTSPKKSHFAKASSRF